MSRPGTREGVGQRQPFVVPPRIGTGLTIVISVLAIVLVVVSSWVARDGDVPGWEESVLIFVNEWPDWLEPPMWVLQQVGVIGAPVIAGLVVYYYTRRWEYLVAFAAILPLKLFVEKGVVKNLVDRERPFQSVGTDINVRGPAFEGLAFPSGHVTTSVAVAILLAALLPGRWRAVPLGWAVIVGVARLYYGEHNLLDVVAGAAMGTFFAVGLWSLFLNRVADERSDEALVGS